MTSAYLTSCHTAKVNAFNIKHDCWLMLCLLHALSVALYRNYWAPASLNDWTTMYVRERALSIVSGVNIKRDYCIMPSQSIGQVFYHRAQARIFNHHNMFDYVVERVSVGGGGGGHSCYSQSLLRTHTLTHARIKDNPILFCLVRLSSANGASVFPNDAHC
jgi:hypothetical protein